MIEPEFHIDFRFVINAREWGSVGGVAGYAGLPLRLRFPYRVILLLQLFVEVGNRRAAKILAVLVWLVWLDLKQLLPSNILLIQIILSKIGDIIWRIHYYGGQVGDGALFHHLNVHLGAVDSLPIRLRNVSRHTLLNTQIHIRLLLFFPFLLDSCLVFSLLGLAAIIKRRRANWRQLLWKSRSCLISELLSYEIIIGYFVWIVQFDICCKRFDLRLSNINLMIEVAFLVFNVNLLLNKSISFILISGSTVSTFFKVKTLLIFISSWSTIKFFFLSFRLLDCSFWDLVMRERDSWWLRVKSFLLKFSILLWFLLNLPSWLEEDLQS